MASSIDTASSCIAVRKDGSICTNLPSDGMSTCRIKSHREQDPSQKDRTGGLDDENQNGIEDDGICIAIKQDNERCQNPAHEGFSTCGIASHRQQEEQLITEEENGHDDTRQTHGSSPGMTESASETVSQPLPGDVEAADVHARDQPGKTIPHFTGSGISARPELTRPRPPVERDLSNPRRWESKWPRQPVERDLNNWRADRRNSASSAVLVPQNPYQRQSESLAASPNKRLKMHRTTIPPRFRSSMSDSGDEQDAKELKMTNQLNAFSQGIETLQKSLNALVITQERSHTALQQRHDALEHKIDEIARNDQSYAHNFNESLGHHYNQIDVLIKSYRDMLAAGHQHPQGKLQDSHEKLEHKIDAVLRNDSDLVRRLTDSFSQHHDRIDTTLRTSLETLSTSYQQSHTILHQDHVGLKENSDDHKKLTTKIDTLLRSDQGIVHTLTKRLDDHHRQFNTAFKHYSEDLRKQFEAAFQHHLDNFSARHQNTEGPLRAGYTRLNEKVNGILRDDQAMINEKIDAALREDYVKLAQKIEAILREEQGITQILTDGFMNHGNQISSLAESHSAHEEVLNKGYTMIAEELTNFEALIRDFCVQMHVTQPGDEAAKALRRKRADQYERVEKLKDDFVSRYGRQNEEE